MDMLRTGQAVHLVLDRFRDVCLLVITKKVLSTQAIHSLEVLVDLELDQPARWLEDVGLICIVSLGFSFKPLSHPLKKILEGFAESDCERHTACLPFMGVTTEGQVSIGGIL